MPTPRALARTALVLGPLLVCLAVAFDALPAGALRRLENFHYDLKVRLTMPGGVDRRIVIVDIDDTSIAREGPWPWSRNRLATLVDALFDRYGVRTVAFDLQFPDAERPSALTVLDELQPHVEQGSPLAARVEQMRAKHRGDERFAEAIVARQVVLGYAFTHAADAHQPRERGVLPRPLPLTGETLETVAWLEPRGYVGNFATLQANAAAAGFIDTPLQDEDGVIRRLPLLQRYNGGIYESLPLATARIAQGGAPLELRFAMRSGEHRLDHVTVGKQRIHVDERGTILAPFRGHLRSFPYISAVRILHGEVEPQALKDAIVLVGTSARTLKERQATPVHDEYIGVEAHANAVAALLDGSVLKHPWWAPHSTSIILLAITVFFVLVVPRLTAVQTAVAAGLIGASLVVLNLVAWHRAGLVLPLVIALVYLAGTSVLLLSYGYFVESRRKRHLSRIFSQYVPPEIVEELDTRETDISLEGDSREMSVLFSDVRGFTTLSEGLSPRELTQLMNSLLTPLTEVIHTRRGTIDKYMGDAIMSFWGAPLPDPDHARNAVLAGLGLIECTARLRAEFAERGWPPVHVGVGVSTGPMSVGNMGSRFRMAYTVLGDTVNLGSRLEGLTRRYAVDFIVSGVTAAAVPDVLFRELDAVCVKGRHEPVAIFEPLGLRADLPAAELARTEQFHEALRLYRLREFRKARQLLEDLARQREETLIALYLERVSGFIAEPPPAAWDGVFVYQTK